MGFFQDLKEDLSQAASELTGDSFSAEEKDEMDIFAAAEASMGIEHAEEADVDDTAEIEAVLDSFLDRIAANAEEADAILTKEAKDYDMPVEETVVETEVEKEPEPEMVEEEIQVEEKGFVYEPPKEEPHYYIPTPAVESIDIRKKTEEMVETEEECSTIMKGMTVKGNIISNGSLDIYGGVEGNIDITGQLSITGILTGDAKAGIIAVEGAEVNGNMTSEEVVQIGRGSVIKGNIYGKRAIISGAIKGDIDIQGPVILDSTAIVMGNIKSKSVQINNGAVIEGMCSQCYADVSPSAFFGN